MRLVAFIELETEAEREEYQAMLDERFNKNIGYVGASTISAFIGRYKEKYGVDIRPNQIEGFDKNWIKGGDTVEFQMVNNKDGYDADGYDKDGYDKNGYHKDGTVPNLGGS